MLHLLVGIFKTLITGWRVTDGVGRRRYHRPPRRVGVAAAILYLHVFFFLHRALSSVVALGASIICNRIPGLSPRQRTLCQGHPDAMVAAGEGAKMALSECQHQFRKRRWNCSVVQTASNSLHSPGGYYLSLGRITTVGAGTKEVAYTYAIRSAAVAYAVTQACSLGNLIGCGCDKSLTNVVGVRPRVGGRRRNNGVEARSRDDGYTGSATRVFRWGGCSADVRYGLRFSRVFLDAREVEEDSRSLMNLHNNRAGRKALRDSIVTECKCHGVSGSCTMKTCWITLPRFRAVGDRLTTRFRRARRVESIRGQRAMKPVFLRLRRRSSRRSSPSDKKPVRRHLVYLDASPSYCEQDTTAGSLGTSGRRCNRTVAGTGGPGASSYGCDSMCCGRGYDTRLYTRRWQCGCKFHWCCKVECQSCSERIEEYTCK